MYMYIINPQTAPTIIMCIIALLTLLLNIYIVKHNNERFRKKEMDKKPNKTYVDNELKRVEERLELKIKNLQDAEEETRSIIEGMAQQVKFIYEAHYKP